MNAYRGVACGRYKSFAHAAAVARRERSELERESEERARRLAASSAPAREGGAAAAGEAVHGLHRRAACEHLPSRSKEVDVIDLVGDDDGGGAAPSPPILAHSEGADVISARRSRHTAPNEVINLCDSDSDSCCDGGGLNYAAKRSDNYATSGGSGGRGGGGGAGAGAGAAGGGGGGGGGNRRQDRASERTGVCAVADSFASNAHCTDGAIGCHTSIRVPSTAVAAHQTETPGLQSTATAAEDERGAACAPQVAGQCAACV